MISQHYIVHSIFYQSSTVSKKMKSSLLNHLKGRLLMSNIFIIILLYFCNKNQLYKLIISFQKIVFREIEPPFVQPLRRWWWNGRRWVKVKRKNRSKSPVSCGNQCTLTPRIFGCSPAPALCPYFLSVFKRTRTHTTTQIFLVKMNKNYNLTSFLPRSCDTKGFSNFWLKLSSILDFLKEII